MKNYFVNLAQNTNTLYRSLRDKVDLHEFGKLKKAIFDKFEELKRDIDTTNSRIFVIESMGFVKRDEVEGWMDGVVTRDEYLEMKDGKD